MPRRPLLAGRDTSVGPWWLSTTWSRPRTGRAHWLGVCAVCSPSGCVLGAAERRRLLKGEDSPAFSRIAVSRTGASLAVWCPVLQHRACTCFFFSCSPRCSSMWLVSRRRMWLVLSSLCACLSCVDRLLAWSSSSPQQPTSNTPYKKEGKPLDLSPTACHTASTASSLVRPRPNPVPSHKPELNRIDTAQPPRCLWQDRNMVSPSSLPAYAEPESCPRIPMLT